MKTIKNILCGKKYYERRENLYALTITLILYMRELMIECLMYF